MRILIIGAGDIGFHLAKRLASQDQDITMIEANPQLVQRASEQLDAFVINGNGASYRVLQEAGLESVQIVAAMTDSDEANLMACRLAKKSGVPTTIARVRNPQFTEPDFMLSKEELGTDLIIHPEKEAATAIVQLIHQSCATYALELENGNIDVLGVRLDSSSPMLDMPLMQLSQRYGNPPMRVVAIGRQNQTLIPRGNDVLTLGDEVFVVCEHEYTPRFIQLTGRVDSKINNVMILGGGLIGRFVAQAIQEEAYVKIIEADLYRAQNLADILPRVLIINGDGTDFDLLESEGLGDMDAFVAVTGDDEKNLISTLVAQHANIPRAIALANKSEYLGITARIGVDAVVSKQILTVNTVQRYIQEQQVASIAQIAGGKAHMVEYITNDGCKITRNPLSRVKFPENAIVGGVMRNGRMIVPQGDTLIQAGDKVVVFALPKAVSSVDKLFSTERSRISEFLHL